MKNLLSSIVVLMAFTAPVFSGCVGTSSFQTCTDNYGNSYTTTRSGESSYTNGYNSQTGSSWNQQTNGGLTTGQSSDGSSWSRTDYGNGFFGTDANGNSYSCIRSGGQTICN